MATLERKQRLSIRIAYSIVVHRKWFDGLNVFNIHMPIDDEIYSYSYRLFLMSNVYKSTPGKKQYVLAKSHYFLSDGSYGSIKRRPIVISCFYSLFSFQCLPLVIEKFENDGEQWQTFSLVVKICI